MSGNNDKFRSIVFPNEQQKGRFYFFKQKIDKFYFIWPEHICCWHFSFLLRCCFSKASSLEMSGSPAPAGHAHALPPTHTHTHWSKAPQMLDHVPVIYATFSCCVFSYSHGNNVKKHNFVNLFIVFGETNSTLSCLWNIINIIMIIVVNINI